MRKFVAKFWLTFPLSFGLIPTMSFGDDDKPSPCDICADVGADNARDLERGGCLEEVQGRWKAVGKEHACQHLQRASCVIKVSLDHECQSLGNNAEDCYRLATQVRSDVLGPYLQLAGCEDTGSECLRPLDICADRSLHHPQFAREKAAQASLAPQALGLDHCVAGDLECQECLLDPRLNLQLCYWNGYIREKFARCSDIEEDKHEDFYLEGVNEICKNQSPTAFCNIAPAVNATCFAHLSRSGQVDCPDLADQAATSLYTYQRYMECKDEFRPNCDAAVNLCPNLFGEEASSASSLTSGLGTLVTFAVSILTARLAM